MPGAGDLPKRTKRDLWPWAATGGFVPSWCQKRECSALASWASTASSSCLTSGSSTGSSPCFTWGAARPRVSAAGGGGTLLQLRALTRAPVLERSGVPTPQSLGRRRGPV